MLSAKYLDEPLTFEMSVMGRQLKTPLLDGADCETKRQEIKRYFENTWLTYESLFSLINNDDAYFLRPEPLRHPLIFYFGHTAVFYINKLILGKTISARLDPALESICAVGVDEMSWDDLDSSHYDWPDVDHVRAYRRRVFELILDLIDSMTLSLPITQDSLAWVILMGCEHERIHLETSSVIMRMLPLEYLTPSPAWVACQEIGPAPENTLFSIPAGTVQLGKAESDLTYGWDNEYGSGSLDIPAFRASRYLVSNGEFLGFVEAGGYKEPAYWTEEGQAWLAFTQAEMPRFWLRRKGHYFQRNLTEEIPLPLNWPVEVNYLEAKAFCNWRAANTGTRTRLPGEPEWYRIRDRLEGDITSWKTPPGNLNLDRFASSCPVNYFEVDGLCDIVGNVWQWTETPIDAFEGFRVHPLYDDFSTPTFDGKHNLIKGGSWISTGNEAIKSSRYAFRRHFFQHAGFRYIEADFEQIPELPENHFETSPDICQQLACHYSEGIAGESSYALALANLVKHIVAAQGVKTERLLDLGCSVGRTSFHLACLFDHVDGIDFSVGSIQYGVQLQTGSKVRFVLENQGEIVDFHEVGLNDIAGDTRADNIHFCQGDAANLKSIFCDYDVVIAQQVLENSYDPASFLGNVPERVNPGGLLILVSDYGFSEAVTPKSRWLGGIKVDGENVTALDRIHQILGDQFDYQGAEELTRVVPRSARKFSSSIQQVTIWRRRG